MSPKSLRFLSKYWVQPGFKWHSPYHKLAHSVTSSSSCPAVHLLLDYGFLARASAYRETHTQLFSLASLGKLEYMRGNNLEAIEYLRQALQAEPSTPKEIDRAVKLLTRLSPCDVISWAKGGSHSRLSLQIQAARDAEACFLPDAKGDEHLLNANAQPSISGKTTSLNAYWREMGLSEVCSQGGSDPFDIRCFVPTGKTVDATPIVSVVMTVHNGERYLLAAALSILEQNNVPLELIIIDDASNDGTWSIINALQRRFPGRIISERLPMNVGTYRAKNLGLTLCTREFVAFQDADDWSHPARLATALEWLKASPRRIATTSRYVRLSEDGKFYSPARWPIRQWSPNTLVFRREPVLRAIGHFDEVKVGADTSFFEALRAHFGDHRLNFQQEVNLVAMGRSTSLMHGSITGIDEYGYSAARIQYRERVAEDILQKIMGLDSRAA